MSCEARAVTSLGEPNLNSSHHVTQQQQQQRPCPASFLAVSPSAVVAPSSRSRLIYTMAVANSPSSDPDDAPQWGLDMEHRILWSIHSLRVNVAIGRFEREQQYVFVSILHHHVADTAQSASWAAKRYLNSAAVDAQDPIYALELPSPPISIVKPLPPAPGEPPNRPPDILPVPPAAGVHPLFPKTMDALNNLSGSNLTTLLLAYNVPGKVPRTVQDRRIRFAQFIGVSIE